MTALQAGQFQWLFDNSPKMEIGGETVPVELIVPEDDLKLWDSGKHAFALRKGRTRILVGASSEDIRLLKRIRLQLGIH